MGVGKSNCTDNDQLKNVNMVFLWTKCMNNVLCEILVISSNMAGLCREEQLAVGPYWIFLPSHLGTSIG